MRTIHLNGNDPTAKLVTSAAFPAYTGRKFKVTIVEKNHKFNLTSGWEDGSRDFYAVVRLSDMTSVEISQLSVVGNNFNRSGIDFLLPEGFAVVEHSIFLGKDAGITIFITEANAMALLPAPVELTENEKKVLGVMGLKNTYGGQTNVRQRESGLTPNVYVETVALLKEKGFLDKRGAITPEGRNARSSFRGY